MAFWTLATLGLSFSTFCLTWNTLDSASWIFVLAAAISFCKAAASVFSLALFLLRRSFFSDSSILALAAAMACCRAPPSGVAAIAARIVAALGLGRLACGLLQRLQFRVRRDRRDGHLAAAATCFCSGARSAFLIAAFRAWDISRCFSWICLPRSSRCFFKCSHLRVDLLPERDSRPSAARRTPLDHCKRGMTGSLKGCLSAPAALSRPAGAKPPTCEGLPFSLCGRNTVLG